jgi:hypothetical protein
VVGPATIFPHGPSLGLTLAALAGDGCAMCPTCLRKMDAQEEGTFRAVSGTEWGLGTCWQALMVAPDGLG